MSAPAARGIIEGFYGPPYETGARLRLCDALAERGLGSYLLCPKSDRVLRSPLLGRPPAAWSAELVKLLDHAAARGVAVRVGLSPLGIVRGPSHPRIDEDRWAGALLLADHLVDLGVLHLAVLFDDTRATFLPMFAMRELGRRHGELGLRLRERVHARTGGRGSVTLVGAIYHGAAATLAGGREAYLRGIADEVGREVPVGYTGPHIFSPHLSEPDLRRVEARVGLSLWVWNNAVTNDWLPLLSGELFGLRPVERLCATTVQNYEARDLRERDMLINGMREPELFACTVRALDAPSELVGDSIRLARYQAALARRFEHAPSALRVLAHVRGHPLVTPWQCALEAPRSESERLAALRTLRGLDRLLRAELAGDPALQELLPSARVLATLAERRRAPRSGESRWQVELSHLMPRSAPSGRRAHG